MNESTDWKILNEVNRYADDDAYQGTQDGDDVRRATYLCLVGLLLEVLDIDVHREDRREGIERRTDGRNQGRSQYGQHQSHHADGEEMGHHEHIRIVRLWGLGEDARLAKGEADNARNDVDGNVQDLEPAAEVGALLSLAQRTSSQNGLHHTLVGAPEPDAHHGVAQQDRQQREIGVRERLEEVPIVRRYDVGVGQ